MLLLPAADMLLDITVDLCFYSIMSDVGDNNFIRYIYRGEEGEIIPEDATHITIDASVTVIHEAAFYEETNIIEVICVTMASKRLNHLRSSIANP